MTMFHIDIYLESSSWFLGVRERWGGYVMAYERQDGELYTVEGFQKITGTYNHVLLHMLNAALVRVGKPSEIHVCSANGYILDMMEHNLSAWAANGFMNKRGEPVKDAAEWKVLWKLSRNHIIIPEHGLHEFSHWMKGEFLRIGREGEIVDNSVDKAERPYKYKEEIKNV